MLRLIGGTMFITFLVIISMEMGMKSTRMSWSGGICGWRRMREWWLIDWSMYPCWIGFGMVYLAGDVIALGVR